MPAKGRMLALFLVALACGLGSAASQEAAPAPAYTEEELISILKPVRLGATRSLSPGTGPAPAAPAPGTPGSGLLPDLQVLFPFNSAELTPGTTRQLDALGRALQSSELAALRFRVAGHTDATGPDSYNDGLSERRAAAVAGYLERNYGVEPRRLEPRGYGKRQLLDAAAPESARNRRVEIVTLQ